MAHTTQALRNALTITPHPVSVTSDNDKEFVSKEFIAARKDRFPHYSLEPSNHSEGKFQMLHCGCTATATAKVISRKSVPP
jgi:hypothetical protein